MAHRVVDAAEIVEVDHDQAERSAVPDGALELILERGVVQEPGQPVGLRADLDRAVDLGVLEGDRHLRGEQLDEIEFLGRERVADPEALHRQDADRARPTAQGNDDKTAIHRRVVGIGATEVVDPRVVALVVDVDGFVVVDDPRGHPGLARFPRLHVAIGVDTASRDRVEETGDRVEDFDRDVVAGDESAEPIGDALEDRTSVERGEDRLGDLEQCPLAEQLLFESG